jgi:enamine deaminase RidA (YjgF/YER057c/UK114 family)
MTVTRHDITSGTTPRMSRCVVNGDMVYLAGLTAADRSADIKGQTQQILDAIDGYLAKAGTDKSKLLQANIWITDTANFAALNEVWNAWVDPENPPVRACVQAELMHPDLSVEIMVTATR